MKPMVSVIVPVYNAEQTIRRCVASILDQQFTDLELLLVDDGSTDGSGAICDEFAARDARVTAIHQKNAGVSAARNHALDLAQGVYLQFLDSDDWITPDATRSLVRAAEAHRCDLVIADFYRVVGERLSRKGDIDEDSLLTREEYAAHMMENPADFYYGVLWNKLYRRELVERYHLRMDPEVSWCEDFYSIWSTSAGRSGSTPCLSRSTTMSRPKGSLASQSLSISRTVKMKLMIFESYHQFYKEVLDEESYERCRAKVYRFLLDAAGDGAVPPLLPTSQRLGDEACAGLSGRCDGKRPPLRRLPGAAASGIPSGDRRAENGLSLQEAQILLSLHQLHGPLYPPGTSRLFRALPGLPRPRPATTVL